MFRLLQEKLFQPLLYGSGYTPVTTAFVAVLFLIVFYALWGFARRYDQRELRRAAYPWFIAGGMIRFLDPRLVSTPLLRTPLIWFLLAFAFILFANRSLKSARTAGIALIALALPADLLFLNFNRTGEALGAITVTFLLYLVLRKLPWMSDISAWLPQLFEAWITSFGVYAGLREEHVLANVLMNIDPFLFGAVKTVVIAAVFYLLKDMREEERIYAGTAIAALGAGPGIRDLLELLSL